MCTFLSKRNETSVGSEEYLHERHSWVSRVSTTPLEGKSSLLRIDAAEGMNIIFTFKTQPTLEVRDVMNKRTSNMFRISLLASRLISLMWTQSFLPASLQGTISSRGARHMDSPMDEFNNRMSSHGFVQDDNTTRDPHGKGDILGKGEARYADLSLH